MTNGLCRVCGLPDDHLEDAGDIDDAQTTALKQRIKRLEKALELVVKGCVRVDRLNDIWLVQCRLCGDKVFGEDKPDVKHSHSCVFTTIQDCFSKPKSVYMG